MKWKYFGYICAIGFFAYLFFVFCESVQNNGMSYTFLTILNCVGHILLSVFCIVIFWYLSKILRKSKILRRIDDKVGDIVERIPNFICYVVFIIVAVFFTAFIETSGIPSKVEEIERNITNYIEYQKFEYKLHHNFYKQLR